jgi:glycosyltransferase involved in cell wall biosynthesis
VEQTILSVLEQSYKNIEYIVIDGNSTDGSMGIIEKHRTKISKVISEKDQGLYDALNKGIEAASGDVIGFLHSDDFYLNKDVIADYAKVFENNNCDGVYSDLYYVDRNNTQVIKRKWKSGIYKDNSFLNGWMPPHPTFLVKKDIYRRFGKFNLQLKSAADYELMLRFIYKYKIKICYLAEYTVKMRVGGKSNLSLKNRWKANLEDRRAWKINHLKPRFYTLYLKPLRKLFQFL